MSALPTNAPAWAWPNRPFGDNQSFECRDATALRPWPDDKNLRLATDVRFSNIARLSVGRTFRVLTHDANDTQEQFGVGRRFYLPTAEDVACVRRLFPDLSDPENPNWTAVRTRLTTSGRPHPPLRTLSPPELLALVAALEPPAPEPARAPHPDTSAPHDRFDSVERALPGFIRLVEQFAAEFDVPSVTVIGRGAHPTHAANNAANENTARTGLVKAGAELVRLLSQEGSHRTEARELQQFLNAVEAGGYQPFRHSWGQLKAALQVAAVQPGRAPDADSTSTHDRAPTTKKKKPAARRKGRRVRTEDDPEVKRENKLYRDWKASGLQQPEFLGSRGIDPGEGKLLLDRARKRLKRAGHNSQSTGPN